jgi:exodeoxyribonuclease-5
MEWTPEQQGAIDAVLKWHEALSHGDIHQPPVFRLFGYAGTGKTTIAKAIAEAIGGNVIFAAFTGKAALVLNSKGCYGARTIHSLIYIPRAKCAQKLTKIREQMEAEKDEVRLRELQLLFREESKNLKKPAFNLNLESELREASLLILDEVSMVDMQIGQDLESFGCPILALGDPAQLPPVRGTGYFTCQKADCLLTEIHRQAAGSPILAMATAVRAGRSLNLRPEGDAKVVKKNSLTTADLAAFDQVICGRNVTRRRINSRIRERVMGIDDPLPVVGDRLICLRNDADTGLLNGSQWDVVGVEDDPTGDKLLLTIAASGEEDAYSFTVTAHKQYFLGTEDEIPHYEIRGAQCFDFAYAITCHKSQGSQYDSVCIIDESSCFRQDASRWMYTALTRAAKTVTVIQ